MDSEITGCACGTCLNFVSASHVPSYCFACGANYERAPFVLVMLDISASVDRGTVSVTPRIELDFRGPWDAAVQADIRGRIGG